VKVGARDSPLSRAQVQEVQALVPFKLVPVWVKTMGDRDKKTSLRSLKRTNFFTKELDEMLLRGEIDAAIHSAKDLPDPIPKGLKIAATTQGLDPRDSLVLRGDLRENMVVATSSVRREAAVLQLQKGVRFVDVRGTIHERLALVERGEVDGVVIAEAALIRLKLTHLKRVSLPGETAEGQGRLSILVREDDHDFVLRD
jgi:hydroxymethylbilane synthase